MVTDDDKECSVWLASKGSLAVDQQEYGAWLRASLFTSGRKTFMAVEGIGNVFGAETPVAKPTTEGVQKGGRTSSVVAVSETTN